MLHSRCMINRFEHPKELTENVGIIIDKLNNIEEYAKSHGLHNYIDNFDILYAKAQEDAKELEKQTGQAIQDDQISKFSELNSQAKNLK